MLSAKQKKDYYDLGFIILKNQIPMDMILKLRDEISKIESKAKLLKESNDQLDLEDSHTPSNPRIRRIKLPHTQSNFIRELMFSHYILEPVKSLIGPNLRLHTSKLNMKLPEFGAPIEWHQDFAFYPHTNDDVLAVAIMIDDMKKENGPLQVFPGSHKGPIFNHHVNGVFVGGIDLKDSGYNLKDAKELNGTAGSMSIHHARLLHGSALNTSSSSRRLLFFEILAADAYPIMGGFTKFINIEEFDKKMLCGETTNLARLEKIPIRIPEPRPKNDKSIYEVQKGITKTTFEKFEKRKIN